MPARIDRMTGDTIPNPPRMRDSFNQPIRTTGHLDTEAMRVAKWAGIDELGVPEPAQDRDMARVIIGAAVELEGGSTDEQSPETAARVARAASHAGEVATKGFDDLSPATQRLVARAASHVSGGSKADIMRGLNDVPPEQLALSTEGMSAPTREQQAANAAAARRGHYWQAGRYQRRR